MKLLDVFLLFVVNIHSSCSWNMMTRTMSTPLYRAPSTTTKLSSTRLWNTIINNDSNSNVDDAADAADATSNDTVYNSNDHVSAELLKDKNEETTASRRQFIKSSTTAAASAVATATIVGTNTATAVVDSAVLASSSVTTSAATAGLSGSITLPPIGLGAWAWGDSLFWGYDKKNDEELQKVFDYAVTTASTNTAIGSTFLDTAELYGIGRSESLIGEFAKTYNNNNNSGASPKIQVATKFAPFPWRTKAQDVVSACEKSLQRLNGQPIDLYQIHFPNAYANAAYWDGLALAYEKGLVKAIGVSNYGVDATRACHKELASRGIQLASNQIQLSLLYRWPLENGLLQTCKDLDVQVLSYSPLGLGMLTGKYTSEQPPSGPRKSIYKKLLTTPDYANLLATMDSIALNHSTTTTGSVNKAQVSLNWARAKGTIPIPGARTINQIRSNYGALDWSLSSEEIHTLDTAASKVGTFVAPDAAPFPSVDKDTGLIMFDS